LVYHCVDDLASYPGIDSERFRADERRLIEAADCVIASSRPLVGLLTDQGADEVVYWPNPADTELFGRDAKAVKDRLRPKLGFVGAVAEHKLDVDLIREVAIRLPGWDIELVGPVGHGLGATSISTTTFPENVRLLGAVERERLPDVVSQFDVAMVPYRLTPYTRGVFPMKVFEYLAAGRPVISTPLPSLVGEVRHVTFASEAAAFAAAVREAHASDTSELRKRRRRYADGFSWSRRTSEALDLLTELAA
jgi:glycosyltransferase involved in cell wall biosynthesis